MSYKFYYDQDFLLGYFLISEEEPLIDLRIKSPWSCALQKQ